MGQVPAGLPFMRSYKMYKMNITNAQYIKNADSNEPHAINCLIDGIPHCIPMKEKNSEYIEIMRQVESGELTIAAAD